MKRLSVITAFRNAAPYLPDMLVTLSRAATDDMEFIAVDDDSTDDSLEILERFPAGLPDLKILHNDTALGPASSRNAAMEVAGGRYIAFVDGDDWVAPDYLTGLADAMDRYGCDFVRSDHVRVTGTRRSVYRAPEWREETVLLPSDSILPANRSTMVDFPYSHSGAYRRTLLDEGLLRFPDGFFTAEDRPWIWRLHLRAKSFVKLPIAGYFYRRGVASSLTQVGDIRQLDFIRSFELAFDEVEAAGARPAFVDKAIRQYAAVLVHHKTQEGRLERGLRRRMNAEILRPLQRFSPDTIGEALADLDPERRRTLRGLGLELSRW